MRSRVLFVTYYRLVPTAQVGVLKRCVRLIPHLAAHYEIHLVNFGPFPEDDPVVGDALSTMVRHDVPDTDLGDNLWAIFGELGPVAVVLGETPLRGSMRLAHRVANRRGLHQVVIENHYAAGATRFIDRIVPRIDRYLLLGLGTDATFGPVDARRELVPPLVRLDHAVTDAPRHRLCIVGYDEATLLAGLDLLGHLPPTTPVDIVTLPAWRHLVDRHPVADESRARIMTYPSDEELYGTLANAQVVFGKAGFQQVVEALLLGAHVVCRVAGGGIEPYLLPDHLLPYVRFLPNDGEIPALAAQVSRWFDEPVVTTWLPVVHDRPDTVAYAAERLHEAIGAGA